eukprot:CAMPEP_0172486486 /NCGR_PEP_ID=MMETSP1066-20121228/15077_1 /TAXON_ID=671091 /ORGANISM="Coscinodiscus wailesii, Strain CCMP2513" /LENGTH=526 /DNA_ID=CAMNT_0013252475 /DNA_START=10 /DNA_END=1590 /DNA_ORIENTATION=+
MTLLDTFARKDKRRKYSHRKALPPLLKKGRRVFTRSIDKRNEPSTSSLAMIPYSNSNEDDQFSSSLENDEKVEIDNDTMEAMKIEFEGLTPHPQSEYNIAMMLKNNNSVTTMYLAAIRKREREGSLTREFDSLSIDNYEKQMNPLKHAMNRLSKQTGSLERMVNTWEELVPILETVLVLPVPTTSPCSPPPSSTPVRSKAMKSWRRYLDKLQLRFPFENWRQVPSPSPPRQLLPTPVPVPVPAPKPPTNEAAINRIDAQIKETEARRQKKQVLMDETLRQVELLRAQQKAAPRPLSEAERRKVQAALNGVGPGYEVLAKGDGGDVVTRDSLQKLQPRTWLNDEVIHYFFMTLAKRDEAAKRKRRCHFFKSFFVTKLLDEGGYNYRNVRRWSKRVPGKDVFELDKIFFPVNLGNMHWCLAAIFMQEKKIQYYDSMGGAGKYYIDSLFEYLKDEMKDKKKIDGHWDDWNLVTCTPETPQQMNGFDCGVFTCMFADYLSQGKELTFTQDDVTPFREKIALSILNGKAVD